MNPLPISNTLTNISTFKCLEADLLLMIDVSELDKYEVYSHAYLLSVREQSLTEKKDSLPNYTKY